MITKNKKNGFTFVELLVVLLVISVSIVGSVTIINNVFSRTVPFSSQLTASYLAQEGVELTRKVRDHGWFQDVTDSNKTPWEEMVENIEGEWRIDYESQELESGSGADFFRLYKNDKGFFLHGEIGEETTFSRKVEIEKIKEPEDTDYHLFIIVTVWWEEKDEMLEQRAYTKLYNWYE